MSLPNRTSIVFRKLYMHQIITTFFNSFGNVFFFNIGVKSIEHDFTIWMIYVFDKAQHIIGTRKKIGFKTIQILDAQRDIFGRCIFR